MNSRQPRVYLDACVYIAAFSREAGRWEVSTEVLRDGQKGIIKILSSELMVIECAKVAPSGYEKINDFFEQPYLISCNIDWFTVREATRLVREAALKPFDALHVATAIMEEVDWFFTYDDSLIAKLSGASLPFSIEYPKRYWDQNGLLPGTIPNEQ